MFNKVNYIEQQSNDPLKNLVSAAERGLRGGIVEFTYPESLKVQGVDLQTWRSQYHEIDSLNQVTLQAIERKAGVYGIFTRRKNLRWDLQYIGQVKSTGCRSRVRSHLVWRNKDTPSQKFTGSKFDEVRSALGRGQDIAFSFIEVQPASLRHFIEEHLIGRLQPSWNFHGTTATGQRTNWRCRGW